MEKKFYAVKNGRVTGIFETWEECKNSTSGYKNAVFKSFKTKKEAMAFLDDNTPKKDEIDIYHKNEEEIFQSLGQYEMIAYIDGSYGNDIKYFSYAGIMFYDNKAEDFAFASNDESLISMRNVAGEVKASMYVLQKAADIGMKKVTIYFDYSGIQLWADGSWKTNNHLTKSYREFCKEMYKKLEINFVKVQSHTNVKYNEYVDKLAKKAINSVKESMA